MRAGGGVTRETTSVYPLNLGAAGHSRRAGRPLLRPFARERAAHPRVTTPPAARKRWFTRPRQERLNVYLGRRRCGRLVGRCASAVPVHANARQQHARREGTPARGAARHAGTGAVSPHPSVTQREAGSKRGARRPRRQSLRSTRTISQHPTPKRLIVHHGARAGRPATCSAQRTVERPCCRFLNGTVLGGSWCARGMLCQKECGRWRCGQTGRIGQQNYDRTVCTLCMSNVTNLKNRH